MIFWLRGNIGMKFALFFEVFLSVSGGLYIQKDNIAKVIGDALRVFRECFFLAKATIDKMNVSVKGTLSFEEF